MADEDDITFTILDEATVERLQKRGDIRLPARKINPDKDIPWNMKQLNSKLLQGILAGDPIPQIRNLFSEVIGNNATSTMRAARTMTTSAENRGRLDSYENLEAQGVVQKKVWIATPDDRTREAHLELDGQEVDIDEAFVDMDGNDLMYPGDPDAAPETVWNCRCSMRTHIVGFKRDDGSVSKVDYGRDTTTHAAQIEEEREDRGVAETVHVTKEDANDAWFEYKNANVMAEFIKTGVMPTEDMDGNPISEKERKELEQAALLMQETAATTKTQYKTVYRGMVMNENDVRKMFTPNETYQFETLTATATSEDVAMIYTNVENSYIDDPVPVIMEIQKPDGIYGFDRDGTEVVMPMGAEFKVTRNYMDDDGVVHVSLYSKKGDNVKEIEKGDKVIAIDPAVEVVPDIVEEEKIEYQYHSTQEKSLKGIIEEGIKPSEGHVGKGVYFADSVDDAKEWTSETSTGGTTVLRVNEEFLKEKGLEKYGADESGYDIAESVYAGVVPLSQIEIKVGDDEWWSLAQYANQHKRLYDSLSSGAKKKVDKIVDEEWEAYLKRKGWK